MSWTCVSPWWLPDGHSQTIVPALWPRTPAWAWSRSRWVTPDGDFIDVDQTPSIADGHAPVLVLFHGLEGSSASHYAVDVATHCIAQGATCVVPHFRGCSGEINRAPRAYHSGDADDIEWIVREVRARLKPQGPVWAVGVSLGGNALLRWAQEYGSQASAVVDRLVAICAPLDLTAAGRAIDSGLNRWLYARMFLRSMKDKARRKWQQYPGLFDLDAAITADTIEAFDHAFTAPLHGFASVADYWTRASAKPRLATIPLPTLLLNPLNDPFVPAYSLPTPADVSPSTTIWTPASGGHVGFPVARTARQPLTMVEAVWRWLQAH